ncbi:MAG: bacillithiol biosynthesis deacetylase BshB1 [Thermoanaerobaculia bacterium]|nr:bacillithiol biosynthesis deacetylase BshB1 [Thermoanaerobaculia bacterium]
MTTKLDVLAIGAHPDDVELGCGGTVALLAEQGRKVGILHLTRGEAGTRGTPGQREDEARAAAEALGAVRVDFLACGDGALRHGLEEEDQIIALLRDLRPDILLGPTPDDRHPDHGRGHRLVADAAFYAGLAKRAPETGRAHRPGVIFSYMQHDPFEPSFVVDVSSVWDKKLASLACYPSQLHTGRRQTGDTAGTPTKVSSPEFRAAMEGRARHFGLTIGAEFGEPFWTKLPLSIKDPMSLLPGGIR